MRSKVLKINELNINKHSVKQKEKCFYSRTTLIRYRCGEILRFAPSFATTSRRITSAIVSQLFASLRTSNNSEFAKFLRFS